MGIDSEAELFQIKSKFLSEIPHPKLIWKAIIQTQLSNSISADEIRHSIKIESTDLISSLRTYLVELAEIKLKIANALTSQELNLTLIALYKLQCLLLLTLASYLPKLNYYPDEDLKMTVPIDAYLLLKFLDSSQLNENQIKTYICNTISDKSPGDFDALTLACLRSRKISANAGSI